MAKFQGTNTISEIDSMSDTIITSVHVEPEHLDAFNPGDTTGHEAVTAQSDLYSLGLVLQQLLQGRISFPLFSKKGNLVETLKKMASDRRKHRFQPRILRGCPGSEKRRQDGRTDRGRMEDSGEI